MTTPSSSWQQKLARQGIDGSTLLVLPAVLLLLGLFVYPFAYGLFLSFQPKVGAGCPITSAFSGIRSCSTPWVRRWRWRFP